MRPSRLLPLLVLPALLPGQPDPAPRPPAPPAGEAVQLEAFTVTGTNIRRLDEEKILPVTVMNLEDLDLRGVPTAAELFDTFSIGGPITLDEGNTLGADARGDNSTINLRGLGSGNTLVLLNGRRLPPHPISMAESSVPSLSTNVNNLPMAAISRVEVLRDGPMGLWPGRRVNAMERDVADGRIPAGAAADRLCAAFFP